MTSPTIQATASLNDATSTQNTLVWRNTLTDQTGFWTLNGSTFSSGAYLANAPALGSNSSWRVVDSFSIGNNLDALLWQNSDTGQVGAWAIDSTTDMFLQGAFINPPAANSPGVGRDWKLVGAINANGGNELVFRNPATDQMAVWTVDLNTQQVTSASLLTNLPALGANSDWQIVDIGNYNGANNLGLLWRNQTTDQTGVWLFNGNTFQSGAFITGTPSLGSNSQWQLVRGSDFNGDGNLDLLWQNRTTGQQGIWYLNGTAFQSGAYITGAGTIDANWQIVGAIPAISQSASAGLTVRASAPTSISIGASAISTSNTVGGNSGSDQTVTLPIDSTQFTSGVWLNGAPITGASLI